MKRYSGKTSKKKKKGRRLWLDVTAKGVTTTKYKFIRKLLDSIEIGTYEIPEEWDVTLHWRNKEQAPMRSGEWQEEMTASAQSSAGWDVAVSAWLKRKLDSLPFYEAPKRKRRKKRKGRKKPVKGRKVSPKRGKKLGKGKAKGSRKKRRALRRK